MKYDEVIAIMGSPTDIHPDFSDHTKTEIMYDDSGWIGMFDEYIASSYHIVFDKDNTVVDTRSSGSSSWDTPTIDVRIVQ